jgi:hypothetical protein
MNLSNLIDFIEDSIKNSSFYDQNFEIFHFQENQEETTKSAWKFQFLQGKSSFPSKYKAERRGRVKKNFG